MAIKIGGVEVPVIPSMEGFHEKIAAEVRSIPDVHVNVDVDSGAAAAHIEAVKLLLDSIRDEHVNVDVDDHGSAARTKASLLGVGAGADSAGSRVLGMSALIVAGLAAIIPIAAAASAAIAGIGFGAALGVAGLLVGKLALGNIPQALAAKPAGGGGGSGSNAAAQALQISQAQNAQRQAQIGLTVAERDATDAQRALTQARADALANLQALSNQVTDNALAQRQATLDLATATQNLSVAKANPDAANAANKNALAQVQLQFDQAKQHLIELQEGGKTLATQKAAADKAGVAGAQNVITAQNHVVDTQNALAQAQFQVANSAAQLAQAQTKTAAATGAYGTAVAKLNGPQKQFLAFLQSIRGEFSQLSLAAASSFLPPLQTAITNLLPVLPAVAGFISDIGGAFGNLAVSASKALTGPFWTQFFAFLDEISSPAIATFGSILGSLFTIAAAAFQAFYPALKAVGDTIAGFLTHVGNAIQGGALSGFVSYVQSNLPAVGSFLSAFGAAISNVISAIAPLGGPILAGLTGLLNAIAHVPAHDIQLAAVALGGFAVAAKAASIAKGAGPLLQFAISNPEIVAVVALGVGVGILYAKSKTFHDFVNDKLYPVVKKIGLDAFGGLKSAIGTVGDAIEQYKPQLTELLHAFEDLGNFILYRIVPLLGPILAGIFQAIGIEIAITIRVIADLVTTFTDLVNGGKAVYTGLSTAFTQVKNFISSSLSTARTTVTTFVSDVVSAITGIPDKLLSLGKQFLDAGANLMGNIFTGITNALGQAGGVAADIGKSIVNGIIDFFNDHLPHHIEIPIDPFGHTKGFPLFPNIPRLAVGGAVTPGVPFIGNEQGQEAFMPTVPGFITTAVDTQRMAKALAALKDQPAHGAGNTFQIYPSADLNEVAVGYAVARRIQYA